MNHLEVLGWGPPICISDKFLGWGWCCSASQLRTTVIVYVYGWLRWGIWQHGCGYKLTLKGFFRKSYDLIHCDSEVVPVIYTFSYDSLSFWSASLGIILGFKRGFFFFLFLNFVLRKKTSGKLTWDWKFQQGTWGFGCITPIKLTPIKLIGIVQHICVHCMASIILFF